MAHKVQIVSKQRGNEQWPLWLLGRMVFFACRHVGIYDRDTPYKIIIENCNTDLKRRGFFKGLGGTHDSQVWASRRFKTYPYITKYWRYEDSMQFTYDSPVEMLMHLIAHECLHATHGNPRHFTKANGRCDNKDMEQWVDREAHRIVCEFRNWINLGDGKAVMWKWARQARETIKRQEARAQLRIAARPSK